MEKSKLKKILIAVHLLFWLIPLFLFELLVEDENFVWGSLESAYFDFFYPMYYGTAINAFFFYTCVFWLMPRILKNYRISYAIAGAVLYFFVISGFESMLDQMVAQLEFQEKIEDWSMAFMTNLLLNSVILTVAVGYFSIETLIKTERKKAQLQTEKGRLELDFLKSQVNPHFMFNTLNNLFATARKNKDEETAAGIAKLSGLMRYMIYETDIPEISLVKEVEYLRNFLDLQKMRFSKDDEIDIRFDFDVNSEMKQISPMLLIPFVENAFKHGISLKNPSFIHIRLKTLPQKIIFEVENSINSFKKDHLNSGIGLKNVRRRLDLIYAEKHDLKIIKDANKFTVNLEISS